MRFDLDIHCLGETRKGGEIEGKMGKKCGGYDIIW
jgi:hypothetical protein